MTGFEKILNIIRQEIKKNQCKEIRLGTMKNETDCMMGDVLLDPDDYLVAKGLKGNLKAGDDVAILVLSNEQYIIIDKVVSG